MEKAAAEILSKGEMERGTSGCLYINRNENTHNYILLHELSNPQLKDALEDMLTEEGASNALIVEEVDRNVHIFKMPRSEILKIAVS